MNKNFTFYTFLVLALSGFIMPVAAQTVVPTNFFNDEYSVSGSQDMTLSGSTYQTTLVSPDSIQFKITTLNCEWLSCSTQDPSDDKLQVNNIAKVIATMNSDIVAVQEIGTSSTYATIDTLVSKLGSQWGGHIVPWDASNCSQNQGILYKKATVQFVSSSLITNGGSSNNWSSGRYPALYNINLVVGDTLIPISLINIHAKAMSDATSYARRLGASQSLKTLLDGSSYNTKNIILIGDYNDYLIGTQCTTCSPADSPYKNFMDDTQNYKGLTSNLVDPDYHSPIIDNIIISNELFSSYVNNSDFRETAATATITNYTTTTTDHTPISALFKFKNKRSTATPQIQDTRSSVYPNPVTNGILNFVNPSDLEKQISIFDVVGRNVFNASIFVNKLDIGTLKAGIYVVKVKTGNVVTSSRFIVK